MFLKLISKAIFKVSGWRASVHTQLTEKCLICVAPHTSNWDLFWGQAAMMTQNITPNYVIKESWTKSSLIGGFLRATGAIGIDRSRDSVMLVKLIKTIQQMKKIQLAITPEGTRNLQLEWKKGVLIMAKKLNIPIYLLYIDYDRKEVALAEKYELTGDDEADWNYIRSFYQNVTARHPEKFATGL